MSDHFEALRSAIVNTRPPYCAGTLPVNDEDLVIFYEKDDVGRRINFSDASEDAVKQLVVACEKATFGRNSEDVLDEAYRKAGKLDNTHFDTNLDVERLGFTTAVSFDLLEGSESHRPIRADLYKLNVYGKDAFFKAHKDTPRSTTMFGSLVIVLPTYHEGGALILRHDSKEWTFDSAKAFAEVSKEPQPHTAYVAFFSDVEHEVARVESGYRVTITYNLHYDDEAPVVVQLPKMLPMNESVVKTVLQGLLEDGTFLPDGGRLGFSLRHEYPIELRPKDLDAFSYIARSLKGSDALLMKACKDLKTGNVQLGYEESVFWRYLEKGKGGEVINFDRRSLEWNWDRTWQSDPGTVVHWVTDKTDFNMKKESYLVMGNEAALEHEYGRFCLIVTVGPAANRKTVDSNAK